MQKKRIKFTSLNLVSSTSVKSHSTEGNFSSMNLAAMATVGTKWLWRLFNSHRQDSMALLFEGSVSISKYGSVSTKNMKQKYNINNTEFMGIET